MSAETKPAGTRKPDSIEEPPPLLGTWRNLYVLLLVELGVLVAGFWVLARWASS